MSVENIYENDVTELEFVHLLLAFMYTKGVKTVNEDELCKKLYLYAFDEKYKGLFSDITCDNVNHKVNIDGCLYNEKYVANNIILYTNDINKLYLSYSDKDITLFDNDVNKKLISLIESIANEFAIRSKIESSKLDVYGIDPNKSYHLLETPKGSNNGLILLTDGYIKDTVLYPISKRKLVYSSKNDAYEAEAYRNVEIKDATYVATQNISNENIKKIDIYTKLLDLDKLKAIEKIASDIHTDEESLLVKEQPYIRRFKI